MTTTIMMYDNMSMDDQVRLQYKYTDAAKSGNLSSLIQYMNQGVPIDSYDDFGRNSLHIASYYGHIDIAKYLIDKCSMDINIQTKYNRMHALHFDTCTGQIEMFKYLISHNNVDCNVQDVSGGTSLHYAFVMGHDDMIEYLIYECNNIDVNKRTYDGATVLHLAVGNDDVVKYLIKNRHIDVNLQIHSNGETALHMAMTGGDLELAWYFIIECCADTTILDKKGKTAYDALYDSYYYNDFIVMLITTKYIKLEKE